MNRRTLLAAAPVVALPALPVVTPPHPDARLLALCLEWWAMDAEIAGLDSDDETASRDAVRRLNRLRRTIAGTAPTTLEGLRAKARVGGHDLFADEPPEHQSEYIARAVLREIAAFGPA